MVASVKKPAAKRAAKISLADIRRLRGKYKHLPLMETLKRIKREEKLRQKLL